MAEYVCVVMLTSGSHGELFCLRFSIANETALACLHALFCHAGVIFLYNRSFKLRFHICVTLELLALEIMIRILTI